MKVHFIAIGGSAMHNLALALYNKGYPNYGEVMIPFFEPSKSRLAAKGYLQNNWVVSEKNSDKLNALIFRYAC